MSYEGAAVTLWCCPMLQMTETQYAMICCLFTSVRWVHPVLHAATVVTIQQHVHCNEVTSIASKRGIRQLHPQAIVSEAEKRLYKSRRPVTLVCVPTVILAVYHAAAYASQHFRDSALWQQYGQRAHALLTAKQR